MESSKGQQFILMKSDAALGFLADRTIIAAQNRGGCAGIRNPGIRESDFQ